MSNFRVFFIAVVLVCLPLLIPSTSIAQSTGGVKGVVKDASGAILPGASVKLTNKGTQASAEAFSNDAGAYTFPAVTPGPYTLVFDMPGFRRLVRDDINVRVTETLVIDPILQVGDVSSEITVTGEAPLVQTNNVALGRVVEEVMVTGVPLSGRNFTQILALSPGVVSDVPNAGAYGRNSVNIAANGARPWENSVNLNGISADNANSLGFDDDNDKTGIAVPSPDAIQEFKVQTGLYDAENGRQGGANVNIITKTGTNDLHGTLFEFFRNDALNANEFFRNRNGLGKGVLKQNQFGGTLGGPIIKDKTFFFFSYQGTRQRNGVSGSSIRNVFLPALTDDRSAARLGQQFGGQSGLFGGTPIARDGSNINPVALAVLNVKLPNGKFAIPTPQSILPNGSGFSAFSETIKFREDQFVVNMDHTLGNRDRFAFKGFVARLPTVVPFSVSSTLPGFGETDQKSNINTGFTYTHTFSPTVLNELRAGYSRSYVVQVLVEPLTSSQIGIKRPVLDIDRLPTIQVSGLFNLGPPQNADNVVIIHTEEISDTLHLVNGKHDIRLGANVQPTQVTRNVAFLTRGRVDFQSFPDFLLGMSAAQNGTAFSNVSSAQAANGIDRRHPRFHNYSAFLQDDYRMSDRFTMNLGVRWQYYGSEIDKWGRKGNFDRRIAIYGPLPAEGTLAGFVVPANASKDRLSRLNQTPPNFLLKTNSLLDSDSRRSFSPRVGIAWRPIASSNNFVIRSGYGIYWSMLAGTTFEQQSFDPWMITTRAGGNSFGPQATFQDPYVPPPATNEIPFYRALKPGQSDRLFLSMDPTVTKPYTQQWSLNLQYGVHDYLFELGYTGSKTTNLISSTAPNQALLASPETPVNGITVNTVANVNLRTPLLSWTPGGLSEYTGGFNAHYNSMQLSVKKQFSAGMTFLGAYTWSHSIDNARASGGGRNQPLGGFTGDYYNRAGYRGSSDFDRTHRVVMSYVYQIPGFQNAHPALAAVLGNWSFSGVTTVQSGIPFPINDSRAGTIYGVGSLAQFAPGKSASDAKLSGSTQDRLNRYFDTSAFGPPPVIGNGTGFGNVGRNVLRGPGQVNFDMALLKEFRLHGVGETSRLEFRSEFFNIFNHAQFGNPGNAVSTASSFGVISNTVVAPRIIQFALKYRF